MPLSSSTSRGVDGGVAIVEIAASRGEEMKELLPDRREAFPRLLSDLL
jgi:hypothetical protein